MNSHADLAVPRIWIFMQIYVFHELGREEVEFKWPVKLPRYKSQLARKFLSTSREIESRKNTRKYV